MIFGLSPEAIRERLRTGEVTVAVYGLGRVGLPIAVAWLRAGANVISSDVDQKIIQKINSGTSPVLDEPRVPEAIPAGIVDGRNILDPAKIPNDIYHVGIGRVRNNLSS